jgi:Prokaryotic membrane lipoprotein lipid attachment site
MRRLLSGTTLLLALAGCSSVDLFHQEGPVKSEPSTNQSPVGPGRQSVPQKLSPAASAAASKTDANESKGGALMECVTESCKINCSPNVKKQFRPKWCVNFKEPE